MSALANRLAVCLEARPLSSRAQILLEAVVRAEYAALRSESRRTIVDAAADRDDVYLHDRAVIRERRRRIESGEDVPDVWRNSVARYDVLAASLPNRREGRPGAFEHFTSAAVALIREGESLTSIVRFGLRLLPGIDDTAISTHIERVLSDQIRQSAHRSRNRSLSQE